MAMVIRRYDARYLSGVCMPGVQYGACCLIHERVCILASSSLPAAVVRPLCLLTMAPVRIDVHHHFVADFFRQSKIYP